MSSPPPIWSRGLITLAGDAAHASLPFLAQGAAMALEDAVVLARTLRRNGIADGFELYAGLRYSRTRRLTLACRKPDGTTTLRPGAENAQCACCGLAHRRVSSTSWLGSIATTPWQVIRRNFNAKLHGAATIALRTRHHPAA